MSICVAYAMGVPTNCFALLAVLQVHICSCMMVLGNIAVDECAL